MARIGLWAAAGLVVTFAMPWRTTDSGAVAVDPELPGTVRIIGVLDPHRDSGACRGQAGGFGPLRAAHAAGAPEAGYCATGWPAPLRDAAGRGG